MAGIIFAIAEEQDEVTSRFRLLSSPPVATRGVEGVEDGCERIQPIVSWTNGSRSNCYGGVLVRPVLSEQRLRIELHDERLIDAFANET